MNLTIGLEFFWYLVVGIAIIAYTVLDGFDLGVGILHPFVKEDVERRTFLNAIGPVWDGNEVWIVIVFGALFAGFPEVYATTLSGMYGICMALIAGLIFRAVAIEFRSQKPGMKWRGAWDYIFSIASFVIAFIIGLAFGNLIVGLPLDENHAVQKELLNLWHPYAILVGLMSVTLFAMHGAIFLVMKTEGPLQEKVKRWTSTLIPLFMVFYTAVTWSTWKFQPHMIERMRESPAYLIIAFAALLAILNIFREERRGNYGLAFISSCLGIALFIALYGTGTFPYLVRSSLTPDGSLTIFNASSSTLTLKILLIIVLIGVPLVIAYGIWIYRIFRGKVKIESSSY